MLVVTEYLSLKIVLILTVGFALASILGYFSNRIKLSPIFGYLIAGYLIGPNSPGFVADAMLAEQLAELGVILMLFGVGLQFKWEHLVKVKNVAIPGAIVQTLIATIIGCLLIYSMGWSLEAGVLFGLAIGVASTVVLVRILSDTSLLHTSQGHLAVGWLIVEDIITVIALLLIPTLSTSLEGIEFSSQKVILPILMIFFKFCLLVAIMFTVGKRIVCYLLKKIVESRSQELFTIATLGITFVIATGSAIFFGTSIALGAFIGGMVIGQTVVSRRISVNLTPLKDTFIVIFFLSVGMLFNPIAIFNNLPLFFGTLAIVLIAKPLAAYVIARVLKSPIKTALTVAIALAQIGEFSFILSEEAMRFDILPDGGFDAIVGCSLISISINPLLFKIFKLE